MPSSSQKHNHIKAHLYRIVLFSKCAVYNNFYHTSSTNFDFFCNLYKRWMIKKAILTHMTPFRYHITDFKLVFLNGTEKCKIHTNSCLLTQLHKERMSLSPSYNNEQEKDNLCKPMYLLISLVFKTKEVPSLLILSVVKVTLNNSWPHKVANLHIILCGKKSYTTTITITVL